MKVADILILIKQSAGLNEEEYQEVEKSFYEIVNLKMVKILGETLKEEQQNSFVSELQGIKDGSPIEQVTKIAAKFGIDPKTAKRIVDLSVRQAFEEVIKILDPRIPIATKIDLLQITG